MVRLRAFTIIELMVAISIIGLLFAAAGTAISGGRLQARDARRLGDVLLIGKAIDQAAVLSGGAYPRNAVNAEQDAILCADQMVNSSSSYNPAKIDLTAFHSQGIPKDPNPAMPATACTGMNNGYTYHTEYLHLVTPNLATVQQMAYTLEVGLERTKHYDEAQFYAPSGLRGISAGMYPDQDAGTGRYRYLLNGPYCGDKCYGG